MSHLRSEPLCVSPGVGAGPVAGCIWCAVASRLMGRRLYKAHPAAESTETRAAITSHRHAPGHGVRAGFIRPCTETMGLFK